MKWSIDKTNLYVEVKTQYTTDSLFALLKEKAGDELGVLELRKVVMLGEVIIASGVDGYENYIYPKKKKITISQIQTSGAKRVGDLALHTVTDGWSSLLGTKGIKGNQAVMVKIAETIEKVA